MSHELSEFSLIERYFQHATQRSGHVRVGIGDDCAVIDIPEAHQLCLSIDTMVEGVHFPKGCAPNHIGYRALATALSDLAAMGATPSHFTLALTLPCASESWLLEFSSGLFELAQQYRIDLVGGDTTRGPLTVSIQVHGYIDPARTLLRKGAQEGDIVAVTGSLGDAGGGLALLGEATVSSAQEALLMRYYRPEPRIEQGVLLSRYASACIDISDGLVSDAGHVAKASKCLLNIDLDKIPVSVELKELFPEDYLSKALQSGDDYELLFTIAPEKWRQLHLRHPDIGFTEIGRVTQGQGLVFRKNGTEHLITEKGYQHFG